MNDYDIKFKQISKILMGDNVEEEKKEKREEYLDLENIDISEMIKDNHIFKKTLCRGEQWDCSALHSRCFFRIWGW